VDEPLPIDTGTSAEGQVPLASETPVARVLIDHPVPHLARTFDYAVPEKLAEAALPGVRVRVKFAGRLRDGYLLERVDSSDHVGPLATIQRLSGPVQVLGPDLLALCEATARRYGGTLADVLRLAIPPRHARGEKAVLKAEKNTAGTKAEGNAAASKVEESEPTTDENSSVPEGEEDATGADGDARLLGRLGEWILGAELDTSEADWSQPARRALACTPGATPGLSWIRAGLSAAKQTLAAGKSVLWLVPDHRELSVLHASLSAAGITSLSVLSADQSPEQRWKSWLRGLLGHTRLTIGTRAAAFAPLTDLGLIICTDDANRNYLDQHAPYPHAREVSLLRSTIEDTELLFVSTDRSAEVQRLVEIGFLADITPTGPARRHAAPVVFVPDEDRDPFAWQRIPSRAWQIMRTALHPRPRDGGVPGPVLVQVPRSGYYPVFACARCQEVARCPRCQEALTTQSEVGPFACKACGYHAETFTCARCRSHQVRSIVRGRSRTVEELRRALPETEIIESGGDHISTVLDETPRLVVATTGAEPYALGGYAAAILLDSLWPGPWMRSIDDSVARRLRAASLVRSREQGGAVYLGDEDDELIRSTLTAFDPVTFMSRQLASTGRTWGFPPYRRILELTGSRRRHRCRPRRDRCRSARSTSCCATRPRTVSAASAPTRSAAGRSHRHPNGSRDHRGPLGEEAAAGPRHASTIPGHCDHSADASRIRGVDIVFAGTPDVAVPALEALAESAAPHPCGAHPTRLHPVGRKRVLTPSPVKARALELGLHRHRGRPPARTGHRRSAAPSTSTPSPWSPSAPSPDPLPLTTARLGWYNLHFSLLPAYRGAAPGAAGPHRRRGPQRSQRLPDRRGHGHRARSSGRLELDLDHPGCRRGPRRLRPPRSPSNSSPPLDEPRRRHRSGDSRRPERPAVRRRSPSPTPTST
jgi:primosomal protein N' (replication factor Y)